MIRNALIATFVVFSGFPAAAQSLQGQDPAQHPNLTSNSLLERPSLTLSDDVAIRVAELRRYGNRFAKAIQLIEMEAAKPTWGWEYECGHSAHDGAEPSPES